MKEKDGVETVCPQSRQEWRKWLMRNHRVKQSIWLIAYKKKSNVPSVVWSDAVDEALCFGWIDSVRKPVDHEKFIQLFSKRKANSGWSKINKQKVQRLIDEGLMAEAGLEVIERAKQNGSWSILDKVEELEIPRDLSKEFKARPGSRQYFLSLSKSSRKAILQWLVLAKRPETQQKRLTEIAELAAQNLKPKQFR